MSDETPKPDIPKPNIPKPSIPAPNLTRRDSAPPVSAVETGAMEPRAQKAEELTEEEEAAPVAESILHKRIIGGIIDYAISLGIYFLAAMILPDFLGKVAWALQIGYMLTRDALPFLKGQSLGKKAMSLRAVTSDGEPLTNNWQASIIRNIPFAIPILPIVEVIILYTRENDPKTGLRLGDDFANTKVVVSEE